MCLRVCVCVCTRKSESICGTAPPFTQSGGTRSSGAAGKYGDSSPPLSASPDLSFDVSDESDESDESESDSEERQSQ